MEVGHHLLFLCGKGTKRWEVVKRRREKVKKRRKQVSTARKLWMTGTKKKKRRRERYLEQHKQWDNCTVSSVQV